MKSSIIKTKQSETKKIPKLRFSGFCDEWEEKRFQDVFNIQAGGDIEKAHVSKLKTDKFKYPIYANSDKNKGLYGYSDIYKIDNECVTVTGRGNLGVAVAHFEKFYPIVRLLILKSKEKSDIKFFEYCINQINFFIESTGVPQLTRPQISTYKINLPLFSEQQKIAEFLGAVDEWIENLRVQKESLESYKKGMMQKIFSQEVRFKDNDGNNFAEWEEKRLGEVSEIIMGQSPDSVSYNTNGAGKYLIQGNADITGRETKPRNWTTQITKECKIGDIIMTVRAPVGYIAKSLHNACIGRGVCAIKNKKTTDIGFLYQFLLNFEKRWIKLEQGSTFVAVNTQDVKKLKLLIPILPEQQKIANFLTSIDNLINSKQQQITHAEQWKKGLMQGLFV